MMMFAYIALFLWPVVVIALFARFRPPIAVVCSILGGYLLLPTLPEIDFPMLPPLNKDTVPAFSALLAAWMFLRPRSGPAHMAQPDPGLPGWLPRSKVINGLLLLLVVGAFATVLTNGDPVRYGPTRLPGLSIYTAFSQVLQAMVLLLPFLLARKYLATSESHRLLLTIFAVAGFCYAFLALYEIRMSPQLNITLYGYFPHGWRQHVRAGGFRPIVFLHHGLWLGVFFVGALLAALGMFRIAKGELKVPFLLAAIWIFMTITLSKTLGSFAIALLVAPAVLFLNIRLQLLMAAAIAAAFLTYPILRSGGYVPVEKISALAERVDPLRARSLGTRLENEDMLLAKAQRRPLFGWGKFGRARVFDENGRDLSTTDGLWTIVIGQGGWVRYISQFGLIGFPVIFLALRRRHYDVQLATSVLALMLAANMIDLIPNATMTPLTWLIAGALVGRLELQREGAPELQDVVKTVPAERPKAVYARTTNPKATGRGPARYSRQDTLVERTKS